MDSSVTILKCKWVFHKNIKNSRGEPSYMWSIYNRLHGIYPYHIDNLITFITSIYLITLVSFITSIFFVTYIKWWDECSKGWHRHFWEDVGWVRSIPNLRVARDILKPESFLCRINPKQTIWGGWFECRKVRSSALRNELFLSAKYRCTTVETEFMVSAALLSCSAPSTPRDTANPVKNIMDIAIPAITENIMRYRWRFFIMA